MSKIGAKPSLELGTRFAMNSVIFKKHINTMPLSILEAEDDYVEAPILLQKIANNTVKIV